MKSCCMLRSVIACSDAQRREGVGKELWSNKPYLPGKVWDTNTCSCKYSRLAEACHFSLLQSAHDSVCSAAPAACTLCGCGTDALAQNSFNLVR